MKNRKGFTIVELVIVIAVIAILAAVLIPTFSSVTASARASAAQQQAKAGLDSILALTEGSLPDGTLFCVTNSDDASLNYTFVYAGNKLTQVAVDEAVVEPYATGVYAVYVTASAWPAAGASDTEIAAAAANKTKVEALLLNVLKATPAFEGVTAASIGTALAAGQKYYPVTLTGAGDTTPAIHVYYTSDIQETQIVFIGNND